MENAEEPTPQNTTGLKFLVGGVVIASLAVIVLAVLLLNKPALSSDLRAQVSFTVYAPSVLPRGYSINSGSPKIEQGILRYTITHKGESIIVAQQSIPDHPPDIANLQNFKQVSTLAGRAAIGSEGGKPIAVLVTNSTLVSLIASKDVPSDVLSDIVTSMKSLPKP